MKTRTLLSILMLLSLALCSNVKTHAQPPRNAQYELSNIFHIERATGHDSVVGELQNSSVSRYPCVRMEFNLHSASGMGVIKDGPVIGVATVELQDVLPNRVTRFSQPLSVSAVTISRKSITDCSPPPETQSVVLYESPDFGGRSRSFPIGNYRLLSAQDFNDTASSIKVPEGLVAIVYEHADDGGGYGHYVDFLEDHANLALPAFNFNKQISYLKIFLRRDGNAGSWIRNTNTNGQFKEGFWRVSKQWPPVYPDPVVGEKPENIKKPVTCNVVGKVKDDKFQYQTRITLYLNGSATQLSSGVTGGKYTILNVPAGTYEVRGRGQYPRGTLPNGMPSGLDIFSDDTQIMKCESDGTFNAVNFRIGPIEG